MERRVQGGQGGFTLIELIAVIVILGILAAVAVPRFVTLQEGAKVGALEGFAGGFKSAAAMNYAECELARNLSAFTGNCYDVGCNNESADEIMQDWDSNITFDAGGDVTISFTYLLSDGNPSATRCVISYN